jgi:hypothetical protein
MNFDPLAAIGMIGVLILVGAYFANQHGVLPSDDRRFPALNLAGSLLIMGSLWTAWNWPSAVIEVVWSAISLYGILRARPR